MGAKMQTVAGPRGVDYRIREDDKSAFAEALRKGEPQHKKARAEATKAGRSSRAARTAKAVDAADAGEDQTGGDVTLDPWTLPHAQCVIVWARDARATPSRSRGAPSISRRGIKAPGG